MKTILITAVLLCASAVQAAGGDVIQPKPLLNTPAGPVTLNAVCASPTAGCAAGQAITVKLNGQNAVSCQTSAVAFNATVTPYFSTDNGTSFESGSMRTAVGSAAALVTSLAINDSVTHRFVLISPYGGADTAMLAVTTYASGTPVVNCHAVTYSGNPLALAMSAKNIQPLNPIGTQDLKDAGRSYVVFSADGVTPAIAETVITFTKTIADTQTTGQTSYVITSGKTLRVQAICASATMGAAANRVRVALRLNTGGACIAGSNILLPVVELAPNYGTATAAEGGASACLPIPDGLEIAGNGTKAICLSEAATAASGTLTVNLVGFEY